MKILVFFLPISLMLSLTIVHPYNDYDAPLRPQPLPWFGVCFSAQGLRNTQARALGLQDDYGHDCEISSDAYSHLKIRMVMIAYGVNRVPQISVYSRWASGDYPHTLTFPDGAVFHT